MIKSINFGPIVGGLLHGRLAAKVEVGETPVSVPPIDPREALTRINTLFEPFADRTFYITGYMKEQASDDIVRDLLEGAHQMGWNRVANIDTNSSFTPESGNRFPAWFAIQQTPPRSLWLRVHVDATPWLRFQPNEFIYHMTHPLDTIEVPNEPGKSAMYVHVESPLTYRDAISFIRDSPHKWSIYDDSTPAMNMPIYPTAEDKAND